MPTPGYVDESYKGEHKRPGCLGCLPYWSRSEAYARLREQHPDWSIGRVRQRAIVEALKGKYEDPFST